MSETPRPDRSHVGRLAALVGIALAIGLGVSVVLAVASFVIVLVLGSALGEGAGAGAEALVIALLVVVAAVVAYVAGRLAGHATVRLGDPPGSTPAVVVPLALFAFLGGWGSLSSVLVAPGWASVLVKVALVGVVVLGVRVSRRAIG